MSIMTSSTSSTELLACIRGRVTRARITPSMRVEMTVEDSTGGDWNLVSWEATCSASDPTRLSGKLVTRVELDPESGLLTVVFSDGSDLTLTPNDEADDESVEDWELITPGGVRLAYGPRGQCHLGGNDGLVESSTPPPSESTMASVRGTRHWKQACREMRLDDQERELASKDLHAWRLATGEVR